MKRVTMQDVADEAGVSQATVSFVLNNASNSISLATQERVLRAVDKLRYVQRKKRRNFSPQEGSSLALLIPTASYEYYMELIRNLSRFSDAKGYRLITATTNRLSDREAMYLRMFGSMQPRILGIIYGFTPTTSCIPLISSLGIPVVVVGELMDAQNIDCVSLDSYQSGVLVAKHLLALGHRKIGYVTSPITSISLSRERRLAGIRAVCQGQAELSVFTETEESELDAESYEQKLGYDLTAKFIKEGRQGITALIGANDMIAIGVLAALEAHDVRIPEDISVCSFDNTLLARCMRPGLTTVDHQSYGRCGLAIELLDNRILNRYPNPSSVNYKPQLVIRGSTGPAKA